MIVYEYFVVGEYACFEGKHKVLVTKKLYKTQLTNEERQRIIEHFYSEDGGIYEMKDVEVVEVVRTVVD